MANRNISKAHGLTTGQNVKSRCHRRHGLSEHKATYHTERPEEGVVDEEPRLLAEAGDARALVDALHLGNGSENVFHGPGTEAGEGDNGERDDIGIVEAD